MKQRLSIALLCCALSGCYQHYNGESYVTGNGVSGAPIPANLDHPQYPNAMSSSAYEKEVDRTKKEKNSEAPGLSTKDFCNMEGEKPPFLQCDHL